MHNDTITALSLFEAGLTKSNIRSMAEEAVNSVMETGNVLQVAEALSAMENFIKEVKANENFKNYTREETAKYPKCFISQSGAKIECAETGTAYDYSQCGDQELTGLLFDVEQSTLALKKRQDFLKTVPLSGMEIRYNDELVTVYPPSKSSTSSYKVTLAK